MHLSAYIKRAMLNSRAANLRPSRGPSSGMENVMSRALRVAGSQGTYDGPTVFERIASDLHRQGYCLLDEAIPQELSAELLERATTLKQAEFLPAPGKIFVTIVEAFQSEGLGKALLAALLPLLAGYFMAVAVGIPIGMMMGVSRKLERWIDPYVNGFFVAPISALVPAMIFWFGVGFQMHGRPLSNSGRQARTPVGLEFGMVT